MRRESTTSRRSAHPRGWRQPTPTTCWQRGARPWRPDSGPAQGPPLRTRSRGSRPQRRTRGSPTCSGGWVRPRPRCSTTSARMPPSATATTCRTRRWAPSGSTSPTARAWAGPRSHGAGWPGPRAWSRRLGWRRWPAGWRCCAPMTAPTRSPPSGGRPRRARPPAGTATPTWSCAPSASWGPPWSSRGAGRRARHCSTRRWLPPWPARPGDPTPSCTPAATSSPAAPRPPSSRTPCSGSTPPTPSSSASATSTLIRPVAPTAARSCSTPESGSAGRSTLRASAYSPHSPLPGVISSVPVASPCAGRTS